MARVPVHHLTAARHLPMIEGEGLRTRADLSGSLGPVDDFDRAAPGTYAAGKRVSAYLDLDHARSAVEEHGAGLVAFSVDPVKVLAAPASLRAAGDPAAYWAAAKPLAVWLADGDAPADLEVHQNLPVRAKYLELRAPLFRDEDLGDFAGIVAAVADEDRLSAKALMHLAIIASDGDFDSAQFKAACALAWRDSPDNPGLISEMVEIGSDTVASAALAEYGAESTDAAAILRTALDATREWADENGLGHGQALLARTAMVLDQL